MFAKHFSSFSCSHEHLSTSPDCKGKSSSQTGFKESVFELTFEGLPGGDCWDSGRLFSGNIQCEQSSKWVGQMSSSSSGDPCFLSIKSLEFYSEAWKSELHTFSPQVFL